MPTPHRRSLVSRTAVVALSLTLCACASAQRPATDAPVTAERHAITVRIDNDARDYVHVYLIGERREWMLGRVEPGARATLRIPEAAVGENAGSLQLAVLAGGRLTARVAGESRAAITIAQPVNAFVTQRWTFSNAHSKPQLTLIGRH